MAATARQRTPSQRCEATRVGSSGDGPCRNYARRGERFCQIHDPNIKICEATRKRVGAACTHRAVRGSRYCMMHDPDPRVRMKHVAASALGGRRSKRLPVLGSAPISLTTSGGRSRPCSARRWRSSTRARATALRRTCWAWRHGCSRRTTSPSAFAPSRTGCRRPSSRRSRKRGGRSHGGPFVG
jgi:hypothetical protein